MAESIGDIHVWKYFIFSGKYEYHEYQIRNRNLTTNHHRCIPGGESANVFKVANMDESLAAEQLYKYDHNRDFSFGSCRGERVVA